MLRAGRAGEGALFVAEELAFEQTRGDGGAVQLDERSLAPAAEVVDGAGHQFFAGARFSLDQDRGIGGCDNFDPPQNVPKRRRSRRQYPEKQGGSVPVSQNSLTTSIMLSASRVQVAR